MQTLIEFLLRSIMALILAMAAMLAAVITFPFMAVVWISRKIKSLLR